MIAELGCQTSAVAVAVTGTIVDASFSADSSLKHRTVPGELNCHEKYGTESE
jgi:sulfur carrier protein ThiS